VTGWSASPARAQRTAAWRESTAPSVRRPARQAARVQATDRAIDLENRLVIYEEGQFTNAGFIHLACRASYFEGHEVLEALLQFSPGLADEDRNDLMRACQAVP
jgi:hypothetical protein